GADVRAAVRARAARRDAPADAGTAAHPRRAGRRTTCAAQVVQVAVPARRAAGAARLADEGAAALHQHGEVPRRDAGRGLPRLCAGLSGGYRPATERPGCDCGRLHALCGVHGRLPDRRGEPAGAGWRESDGRSMTVKKAVVLMAKAPLPGEVKTRLTPRLTAFQAAELYRCFLLDAVEQAQEVCGADVVLAYAPANGLHLLPAEVRDAVPCIPQPGGDLGERMRGVFEALFALGYESVVMTGTDLPTLPPRYTGAAFDLLEDAPVVLGPGLDG